MRITVEKLTTVDLARRACKFTIHGHKDSLISLKKVYQCEHSPMWTQLFWIEMIGIPNFVSVHLVRHSIGVDHYVQTMRDDRGAGEIANRTTPTNHAMLINAQALVNMGRKRLCMKAHAETRLVMSEIVEEITKIDPDLADVMVPECEYRGGACHEIKPCGRLKA